MIMSAWRWGNLGLAFLLELAAVVGLGYWGFQVGGSLAGRLVLGIGTPVVAVVLWGLFAAPKASVDSSVLYWVTAVLVFGGAAVGLWVAGRPVFGVLLAVLYAANLAVIKAGHLTA
jgi:hypothetical protein